MPITRNFQDYFQQIAKAGNSATTEKKSFKVVYAFTPVLKVGTYEVVMRFLPSHPDEVSPFIENRSHMFQLDNGIWFGCDCLSKFGKACPICDYNRAIWKKYPKDEAKTKVLPKWKPKYVSNVLIVRNDNAPETEGKVFRFEYGPLIMGLISNAMTDHEDAEAGLVKGFNPFDWKTGANFIFKGNQAGKYVKNDGSNFGSPKAINKWDRTQKKYISLTDEEIDVIEGQLYTLADCEHKEDKVRGYDAILDSYLKKNGSPLGATEGFIFKDGALVIGNANSAMETPAHVTNTTSNVAAVADDSSMPSMPEQEEAVDSDDFFAKLSSM